MKNLERKKLRKMNQRLRDLRNLLQIWVSRVTKGKHEKGHKKYFRNNG